MTGTRTPPAHLFRDAGSDDEFSMPLLSLKNLLSHLSSPSTAQGATGLTSSRTPASTASAHSRALSPSVAPTPRGPGPGLALTVVKISICARCVHQCHGLSPSPHPPPSYSSHPPLRSKHHASPSFPTTSSTPELTPRPPPRRQHVRENKTSESDHCPPCLAVTSRALPQQPFPTPKSPQWWSASPIRSLCHRTDQAKPCWYATLARRRRRPAGWGGFSLTPL